MEFIFGSVFGCIVAWLIFTKLDFPKKTVAGNQNCKKFRQTIALSFDNIEKNNLHNFRAEIERALKLYGVLKATDDTHYILTKSTACLGEIHNALVEEVCTQPVELISHSINMTYVSLSAEVEDIVDEATLKINATPGSTVTLENRGEMIKVDESGRAKVKIKLSRDELLRGYLEGKATKGGLARNIKIAIK